MKRPEVRLSKPADAYMILGFLNSPNRSILRLSLDTAELGPLSKEAFLLSNIQKIFNVSFSGYKFQEFLDE
jgi:hypothetical protein